MVFLTIVCISVKTERTDQSFAQSVTVKQTFVNSHAVFRGESLRAEGASYGLFVILVDLSVLVNVGILSAADPAVS